MEEDELTLMQKILPGVLALIILAILWGPPEFYPWLFESLFIYAGWFFCLKVIVSTVMERRFDNSNLKPMLIGVFAITFSIIVFSQTPKEIIENLLRATAIWSLIYTTFGWVKGRVNDY